MSQFEKMIRPIGRPTAYDPDYCEMLIMHMSEGYSFESFGAVVGVACSTIYKWALEYPDFSEAKAIGFTACRMWFERMGNLGMTGNLKYFNAGCWNFQMKNRFRKEWQDKIELDTPGTTTIKLAYNNSMNLSEKPKQIERTADVIDVEAKDA